MQHYLVVVVLLFSSIIIKVHTDSKISPCDSVAKLSSIDNGDCHKSKSTTENYCLPNGDDNFLEEQTHCPKAVNFWTSETLQKADTNKQRLSMDCMYDYDTKTLRGELDFPYNVTKKDRAKLIKLYHKELDNFDLRVKYKTICPSLAEITDQGNCDSCWAVAATDVMTDRLCIKSNGTNTMRYSAMDLLSCCYDCRAFKDKGSCAGGGAHRKGWIYWKEVGIVSGHYYKNKNGGVGCRNYKIDPCTYTLREEDKPETLDSSDLKCYHPARKCPDIGDEPTCKHECDAEYTQVTENSYEDERGRMKGKECYSLKRKFDGEEIDIKLEILLHGPVHGFMSVYESLYTMFSQPTLAGNEVEPYLGPKEDKPDGHCPGHSIRIVGWGKTRSTNTSYWIVANSWGEKWGSMDGFFPLHFDHDKVNPKGKEIVYAGIPDFKIENKVTGDTSE